MKKQLLKIFLLSTFAISYQQTFAQRYLKETFADFTKVVNIEYDTNRSLNLLYPTDPRPIITVSLKCDVYQPVGDTAPKRPAVILIHTGSYLPGIINKQTTGSKDDSTIVEMCSRLAKRGFVAVAVDYRLGWNASSTIHDTATGDLLRATFRAMQDVRNCVRFLRNNAATYKIDTSKIIVGGQGTGGYVALALGTVDKRSEIESLTKFQRADFSPMVNIDIMGDWNGLGGNPIVNYGGEATLSGNIHMIFNYGGALGDTSWLQSNSIPTVSMQTMSDPFAPVGIGNVVVPTTGVTVISNASGATTTIPKANALGINNKINAITFTDPISTRAMTITSGVKNLYPFYTSYPAESAPWEWWDHAVMNGITSVNVNGYPVPASGHIADSLSMLTNPYMSAGRAKAYIDTILNFVCPRIAAQFDLAVFTGVNNVADLNTSLSVYPNPTQYAIHISATQNVLISSIQLMDITGRNLITENNLNTNTFTIDNHNLKNGIYFITINSNDGRSVTKKIVIE